MSRYFSLATVIQVASIAFRDPVEASSQVHLDSESESQVAVLRHAFMERSQATPRRVIKNSSAQRKQSLIEIPPCHLRIGVIEALPFMEFHKDDSNKVVNVSGMLMDLTVILSEQIGFSYTIYPFVRYGTQMQDGTWSGLIGALVNKEVDVIIADLSISLKRFEVMDFSISFHQTKRMVFIGSKYSFYNTNWALYLQPFPWKVWGLVLAVSVVVASCLATTNAFRLPFFAVTEEDDVADVGPFVRGVRHERVPWIILLFDVWSITAQQGVSLVPGSTAGRIFLYVASLMAMLIFNCYTSNLISVTTVAQQLHHIDTLENLLKDQSYTIGITPGVSTHELLRDSNDPVLSAVWQRIQSNNSSFVNSLIEGMQRTYNEKYAFITFEFSFSHYLKFVKGDCQIHALQDVLERSGNHFGFQKGSPLRHVFNKSLIRLKHSGIIGKLVSNYQTKKKSSAECDAPSSLDPVNLSTAAGAFLALLIGIPLAIIAVLLERFFHCCQNFKVWFVPVAIVSHILQRKSVK